MTETTAPEFPSLYDLAAAHGHTPGQPGRCDACYKPLPKNPRVFLIDLDGRPATSDERRQDFFAQVGPDCFKRLGTPETMKAAVEYAKTVDF